MEQINAPIVLFAYNRPIHTQKVLDSLALCEESIQSDIYIYCDGAKDNVDEMGLKNIHQVRQIVNSENRFKKVDWMSTTKTAELAKILVDTTYYGWLINYAQITKMICEKENVELIIDKVELVENVLPFRREGNFYCMSHEDEGFVNGEWKKGETTARNEKRFVTEMQQKKINYKEDGLNKILEVLDIVNVDETIYPNTMFINVKTK